MKLMTSGLSLAASNAMRTRGGLRRTWGSWRRPSLVLPNNENWISLMKILVALLLSTVSAAAAVKNPDCSGPDGWPANMAFAGMKNEGFVTNDQLDFKKTKSKKLAYEKIGKDLYRQVHLVTFQRKDGSVIEAVTLSDASSEECSMGNIQVFVVSKKIGDAPKAPY
jgi:hypothetical protein